MASARRLCVFALASCLGWGGLWLSGKPRAADRACVLQTELDGVVTPSTADYLQRAIDDAQAAGCQAVLVRIDTPGGRLDATRDIVRAFLNAPVPVLTLVAPSGARAGSAGMFITLAGHVAAMAPGSNIGAAHPVTGTGQDPEQAGGEAMGEKIENDTAAFARAIAEKRARNVLWAERAVRESASLTAEEALSERVIDLVVASPQALLARVDGRRVQLDGRRVVLQTRDAPLLEHERTLRETVLDVLGNPELSYLLLMVGLLGIFVEIYAPGTFVAGGVGLLAILLAVIGLGTVPVNVGALILIALALGLFVAEFFVVSFGLLSLAGIALLALGGVLLVDPRGRDFFADPSVRISWTVVLPLGVAVGAAALALGFKAGHSRRQRSMTGNEGLLGENALTLTPVGPSGGAVRVMGERWQAKSRDRIAAGQRVVIEAVEGLQLVVRPATEGGLV